MSSKDIFNSEKSNQSKPEKKSKTDILFDSVESDELKSKMKSKICNYFSLDSKEQKSLESENKEQNGGGFYSAVGEESISGMPIYKGYFDMNPPIFRGELLRSSLQGVSCGAQASSQSGGKKRRRKRRTRKRKQNKRNNRRTKNRKSKKNKRRTKKRTYRK